AHLCFCALEGGHAEPVIGRAFARPVGFAHPTKLDTRSRSHGAIFRLSFDLIALSPERGRRESRAPTAPAARVRKVREKAHGLDRVQPGHPGSPHSMVWRPTSCSPRTPACFAI